MWIWTKNDDIVQDFLVDMFSLFTTRILWQYYLLLPIPLALIYFYGNAYLFILLFLGSCFFCRSRHLGSLVGGFVIVFTVLLFFFFPVEGHFIDVLFRMPARGATASQVKTSAQVINGIPTSLQAKLFIATVYGILGATVGGGGVARLGEYFLGKNKKVYGEQE